MRSPTASVARALALLAAFVAISVVSGGLVAGLFLPAVGAAGQVTRSGVDYFESIDGELDQPALSVQSIMLDASGHEIAHFFEENRVEVPLSAIAPVMRQALVAIEDSRFYEHGAIDPKGVLRAYVNNQVGGSTQGASTLTQQYVKNVNLEVAVARGDKNAQLAATAKSAARKLREMKQAIQLEQQFSKDQILERYLNIVNFGDNTYGAEAAARYYFGTTAAKLTLTQAAMLAGLVQLPGKLSPFYHPQAAKERRDTVLFRMHQLALISDKDYAAAVASKIVTKRTVPPNGCIAAKNRAYFCDYVRRLIEGDPTFASLGKTAAQRIVAVERGGLTIKTTLDPRVQDAAWKAVSSTIPPADKSNVAAAAVTVDPTNGRVLAMAQNRYYAVSGRGSTTINYGVDNQYGSGQGFQTGSTFKPFTLAEWLKEGNSLNDVVDASQTKRPFSDFHACGHPLYGSQVYEFHNAGDGENSGHMRVLAATAASVNTAFVDIESRVDICGIAQGAEKLGIRLAVPVDPCNSRKLSTSVPTCYPTLTLGTYEISPMRMAAAYGGFANDGIACSSVVVTAILDRHRKPLPVPTTKCTQAIDPDVAHGVTYALKRVFGSGGTAPGGGLDVPSAGKTGTTNGSMDTWFAGYTPHRATAVWVADPTVYDLGTPKAHREALQYRTIAGTPYSHVYGATIANPIWRKIMNVAVQGTGSDDWPDPPSSMLAGSTVDPSSFPSVLGLSPAAAKAVLERAGLNVRISSKTVTSQYPKGAVADTTPNLSSTLQQGDTVTLILSNGQLPTGGGGGQGGGQGGTPKPPGQRG